MRRLNLFVVSAILAAVFLLAEVAFVKNMSGYAPMETVVFAKTKISRDSFIKVDMLIEKKIDSHFAHKLSLKNNNLVVGRKAIMDIEEGEMLLTVKLGTPDEMEKIKVKNTANRLFSVELKGDQANGWWLMTGQYVDIIYVPNYRPGISDQQQTVVLKGANADKDVGNKTKSTLLNVQKMKNIRIAALIDDKGKLLSNNQRTSLPKYISFEVSAGQDEFLAFAKTNGHLEVSVIPDK